jgi:hypothetical protein
MSGGHFDYRQSYLGYIAEQLEEDIKYNDVEYDSSEKDDEHCGYQLQPETIEYMKMMVAELYKLKELLREYDYAVSGDTSEQSFLEAARLFYGAIQEETG